MLDNEQKVDVKGIDERILPENGFITLNEIQRYSDSTYLGYIDDLAKELERQNIPILKVGTNKRYWIIRLEDLKFKENL
jgi:hypothetical protein